MSAASYGYTIVVYHLRIPLLLLSTVLLLLGISMQVPCWTCSSSATEVAFFGQYHLPQSGAASVAVVVVVGGGGGGGGVKRPHASPAHEEAWNACGGGRSGPTALACSGGLACIGLACIGLAWLAAAAAVGTLLCSAASSDHTKRGAIMIANKRAKHAAATHSVKMTNAPLHFWVFGCLRVAPAA